MYSAECFRKIYKNSECLFPFFKKAYIASCKLKYGMFSYFFENQIVFNVEKL